MVAETCNLIQANLPPDIILLPERMYKNLVPVSNQTNHDFGQTRADLVLCAKAAKSIESGDDISPHVKFVIEFKRGSAPIAEINADLKRLHNFLETSIPDARAFLFVVLEGSKHSDFARKDGTGKRHKQTIFDGKVSYHIRRTVKAAASFKGMNTAHYVHIIEVILDE